MNLTEILKKNPHYNSIFISYLTETQRLSFTMTIQIISDSYVSTQLSDTEHQITGNQERS